MENLVVVEFAANLPESSIGDSILSEDICKTLFDREEFFIEKQISSNEKEVFLRQLSKRKCRQIDKCCFSPLEFDERAASDHEKWVERSLCSVLPLHRIVRQNEQLKKISLERKVFFPPGRILFFDVTRWTICPQWHCNFFCFVEILIRFSNFRFEWIFRWDEDDFLVLHRQSKNQLSLIRCSNENNLVCSLAASSVRRPVALSWRNAPMIFFHCTMTKKLQRPLISMMSSLKFARRTIAASWFVNRISAFDSTDWFCFSLVQTKKRSFSLSVLLTAERRCAVRKLIYWQEKGKQWSPYFPNSRCIKQKQNWRKTPTKSKRHSVLHVVKNSGVYQIPSCLAQIDTLFDIEKSLISINEEKRNIFSCHRRFFFFSFCSELQSDRKCFEQKWNIFIDNLHV